MLAGPAIEWLRVREDGTYVDCTAGAGGHSDGIAQGLTGGRLIAIDRDAEAVALSTARLEQYRQATVVRGNYGELGKILAELGISSVDGIIFDVGVSSMQLDTPSRGFSFQREGPLDMRMDSGGGQTAAEYLASVSEAELIRVLKTFGDVRPARRIARAIRRRCESGSMKTTADLAEAVSEALDFVQGVPGETRTVFQAIRMAVNEELRWFESGLWQGIELLSAGGRLVGITFHSGEDRVLKNVLRAASRKRRVLHEDGRVARTDPAVLKVLTPKPIAPTAEEIRANPRAASAKLRAAEKLPASGAGVS